MKPEEAAAILHCHAEPTAAELRQAFGKAMLAAHPDTGGVGSALTIVRIKEARDVLERVVKGLGTPCKLCGGRGMIRNGFGAQPCQQCAGTGEQP